MSKSIAFMHEEKQFLVQLIKKYPIIENKQTDATSIKKKGEAWIHICDDYNTSSVNAKRTVLQLKRCWDKIKRKRKSVLATERKEIMKTGGGSSQFEAEIIPDVDTILPHLKFQVENVFVSDAGPSTSETNEIIKTIKVTPEAEGETENVSEGPVSLDSNRNRKRRKVLCKLNNRQTLLNKLMNIHLENAKFELECFKNHHEAEMSLLATKLEIEKEKLKQEKLKTQQLEMKIRAQD